MTETTETAAKKTARKPSGLNSMLLADLKSMAGGLGIPGAGSMKKADLVSAIKQAQSGGSGGSGGSKGATSQPSAEPTADRAADQATDQGAPRRRDPAGDSTPGGQVEMGQGDQGQSDQGQRDKGQNDQNNQNDKSQKSQSDKGQQKSANQDPQNQKGQNKGQNQKGQNNKGQNQGDQNREEQSGGGDQGDQSGEGEGGRRNRRRRGRDRTANRVPGAAGRNEPDTTILEDDVLVPAAGILDVLDNYAFVRTSGYLPGTDDVYLSLSMVRKYGLRRGDAVVGQVRQPREGERKEKFNPMVRVDSVNGTEPDSVKDRPDFASMTAVHPTTRLRLETGPTGMTERVIDLVAPLGKGQRGLIVAPPRSGKTTLLRAIAAAVTSNNPECHLMVVLVDERPEEVTEFERTIKGEVIASTLDRPPVDHTVLAELAIERAKRLVELGHDVVVLLDGLSRLGRAYNLAAPSGGRSLPSGLDTTALHPPKRFFGAARSLENAGSLTILATAQVGTGSPIDEALLEEFVDAANAEVRLSDAPEDPRLFPAIDIAASGTRHEEQLVSEQEQIRLRSLRRSLSGKAPHEALSALHERVRGTSTNIELLGRV